MSSSLSSIIAMVYTKIGSQEDPKVCDGLKRGGGEGR